MKKVMDAVNEFKGEWLASGGDCIFDKASGGLSFINGNCVLFDKVCDMTQFNDLVSQLSTNFGESSLKHLHIWQEQEALKRQADTNKKAHNINERFKELEMESEIDWSLAPEGATHYNPSDYAELCKFYKIIDGGYKYYYRDAWCKSTCEVGTLKDKLIERPQPVFTQAMADNGVSATIGMKVRHQGVTKTVTGNSDINNNVTMLSANNIYSIAHTNTLIPIDTRTDKEKAIDAIYDDLYSNDVIHSTVRDGHDDDLINSTLSVAYDKWVGE